MSMEIPPGLLAALDQENIQLRELVAGMVQGYREDVENLGAIQAKLATAAAAMGHMMEDPNGMSLFFAEAIDQISRATDGSEP